MNIYLECGPCSHNKCRCICEKCFANSLCGIEAPKNSKKTLRQIMQNTEEHSFFCDKCGRLIDGLYASYQGSAKTYHLQCFPQISAAGTPKIPDAPGTRHAIAEPPPPFVASYGHVKQLIDSHRELLNTLKFLRQETPAKFLNLSHLDYVITRGENATK